FKLERENDTLDTLDAIGRFPNIMPSEIYHFLDVSSSDQHMEELTAILIDEWIRDHSKAGILRLLSMLPAPRKPKDIPLAISDYQDCWIKRAAIAVKLNYGMVSVGQVEELVLEAADCLEDDFPFRYQLRTASPSRNFHHAAECASKSHLVWRLASGL